MRWLLNSETGAQNSRSGSYRGRSIGTSQVTGLIVPLTSVTRLTKTSLYFSSRSRPIFPSLMRLSRSQSHDRPHAEVEHTFEPKATRPTPGAADFCLITEEN